MCALRFCLHSGDGHVNVWGPVDSIGIATSYRLDGSGSNPDGSKGFTLSHIRGDRTCSPPHLPYKEYQGCFWGVKRPRLGVGHQPPYSSDVRLGAAMPVLLICAFISCRRMNFTWPCTLLSLASINYHPQCHFSSSYLTKLPEFRSLGVWFSHQNSRKVSFYGCTLQKCTYKLHLQVARRSVPPQFHASVCKLWCVMAFRARSAWHEN